jgi:hypothetical protein
MHGVRHDVPPADRASAPEGLLSARTATVEGELLNIDMSKLGME